MPDSAIPNFASFEEMEKWMAKQMGQDSNKKSLTSKKKKGKHTPGEKEQAPPNNEEESTVPDRLIWSTEHFYVREDDSFQQLLLDAKEEANRRNSNVLVFAHNHQYHQECDHLCRRIPKEQ